MRSAAFSLRKNEEMELLRGWRGGGKTGFGLRGRTEENGEKRAIGACGRAFVR